MTFVTGEGITIPTGYPYTTTVIDYSSRDYLSIYADLVARIPSYLPQWTSQSPNDFGLVLLQMFAYVGDILGYYIDRMAAEAFLQTATQPQSILNLAALLNYQPMQSVGASVTLTVVISSQVVGPVTIPAGTRFATLGTATTAPIVFETDVDLVIAGASSATPSTVGQVTATQGLTVTDEQVGISSGTINQGFQLTYNPIESDNPRVGSGQGPALELYVDLGQGPTLWNYSPHLIQNGPFDHVYSLYTAPNNVVYVIFGDGVNGYVPPLGSPITATYVVGQGALGNVGSGVITQPVAALAGITAVTNANPASGGADSQSLNSIRQMAPLALTSLNRGVTAADIGTLALQTSQSVQWASAMELTYQLVNLYIAPTGGGPPSSTLINAVQAYLAPLVMANTTVTILPPSYIGVDVTVEVVAFENFGDMTVTQAVVAALTEMLALPNTGFGYRVALGSIYTTILDVPGVNYAIVTGLIRQSLTTLMTALISGNTYTSLSTFPLPQAVAAGDVIVLSSGTSTQNVVAAAPALAGAQTISVVSFVANAAYPAGTEVQDSSGAADCVFLENEIPVVGDLIVTTTGGISGV